MDLEESFKNRSIHRELAQVGYALDRRASIASGLGRCKVFNLSQETTRASLLAQADSLPFSAVAAVQRNSLPSSLSNSAA